VYPAAGLIDFTNAKTPIYYIETYKIQFEILWSNSEPEGMKQLKKALISLI
jgi:NAD-dependent deacetylase